jgi:3-hydroxymyristoyl/3-hydroxydecanoyl-(acyl carrier protein) dehydratase
MSGKYPTIVQSQHPASNEVELLLNIDRDICYFDGHFPQAPILPGVVQIHWAEHYGREYFTEQLPARESFSQLEAIKFQHIIRPSQQVKLKLTWLADKRKLNFQLSDQQGDMQYATGRIAFSAVKEA